LNADIYGLDSTVCGFVVSPIRSTGDSSNPLVYNTITKEIQYSTVDSATSNWANYVATSNVDLGVNKIFSSDGTTNICGAVLFEGADPAGTSSAPLIYFGSNIQEVFNLTDLYTLSGYTTARVQIWGAGGGRAAKVFDSQFYSGGGGYVDVSINITTFSSLTIDIGQRGLDGVGTAGGAGGIGGGGNGGNAMVGGYGGGGGGGATVVSLTKPSGTTVAAIAGGGGGGGANDAIPFAAY